MKHQSVRWAAGFLISAAVVGQCGAATTISPDDPRISYGGYVRRELVTPSDAAQGKFVRFDRILDIAGKGYRWDNPGVSIRFRTDATELTAILNYSDFHTSATARNGTGVYSVDGIFKPEWSFQTRQKGVLREPETVTAALSNGGTAGFHQYEIFLPYGDSVEFAGLRVNAEARFEPGKTDSPVRYVAYGDSITHGFSASDISKTYPFLVAKEKGWQAINLGLGGRSSTAADGKLVGALKADVVTVLMGANDWQGGASLDRYRTNMVVFISNIRLLQPEVPVYLLTPLWVHSSWNPPGKITDLENYRKVLREIVAARKDPNLHVIEGPELIDPVLSLFDRAPIHPNDKGFAMLAERLAKRIQAPVKKQGAP